ncbi:MAG: M14 family metallopeptidase [Pseudomonadota bacterium]
MLPAAPVDVDLFADSYATARARFSVLARRAGAVRDTHAHPLPGPEGELLATDTAWIGPADAARVLVLQSGLHGVEGFAGSAMQCDALLQFPAPSLPPDTALLFVHAINPWGFAWLRRCNEDGVDLNRNFIDFAMPLPENEVYDELAAVLVPASPPPADADTRLEAWRVRLGQAGFEAAVSRGQFRHPGGFYYGGRAPSWSRRILEGIVTGHALRRRDRVIHLDLHTGIGPYGYGELICDHPPDSRGVRLARRIFGPSVTEPHLGTSVSGVKEGLVDSWWQRELGDRLCFLTLECGTASFADMLAVLRDEHVLHAAGPVDWTAARTRQVKAALRAHFCPPGRDWRELVLFRARQVVAQAIDGLGSADWNLP